MIGSSGPGRKAGRILAKGEKNMKDESASRISVINVGTILAAEHGREKRRVKHGALAHYLLSAWL